MSKPASQLYRVPLPEVASRLRKAIDRGCSTCQSRPVVFFRADDIGIPSFNFKELIASFNMYKLPLCLATVPAWLTADRLVELQSTTGSSAHQWYWHQHGFVHRNFETTGKKQEFGPERNSENIVQSLKNGQHRLDNLLRESNKPVFTPPWNRCSTETLHALQALEFKAVSRSKSASPTAPLSFPDFQVNVDLHTRKELDGEESFNNLLKELEQSLTFGICGIMLHHQRMNRRAVDFLHILMQCLKSHPKISFVHFGDLLAR